jgi:predicted membrane protein
MREPLKFKIILALAVVQAIAGLLRGFNWLQVGSDLFDHGLVLLPVIGALTIMRGLFVWAVALLYVLFVIGALLRKGWARWTGATAAIITLIIVLNAAIQNGLLIQGIVWSIIPAILLIYIFSSEGRQTLRPAQVGRPY